MKISNVGGINTIIMTHIILENKILQSFETPLTLSHRMNNYKSLFVPVDIVEEVSEPNNELIETKVIKVRSVFINKNNVQYID